MLISIGVAARHLGMSTERLRQLADAGKVNVVRDSLGRRFLEESELIRLASERKKRGRFREQGGNPRERGFDDGKG